MITDRRFFGRRRGGDKGWSLSELMVVIFIIGLMAGVAVPAFLNFLKAFRLRTAGRQVIGDMQVARQKAITKNRDFFVFFATETTYDIIESNLQRGMVLAGTNSSVRFKGPIEIGAHLVIVASGTKPAGAATASPFFPAETLTFIKDQAGKRIPDYNGVPAAVFRPDGSVKTAGTVWVRLAEFQAAGDNQGGPRFAWMEVNTNSVGRLGIVSGP